MENDTTNTTKTAVDNVQADEHMVEDFQKSISAGAWNSIYSESTGSAVGWKSLQEAAKKQSDYDVTQGVDEKGHEYIEFGHKGVFGSIYDKFAGKTRIER